MYLLDNNFINICGIIIWIVLYPLLVPNILKNNLLTDSFIP